MTVHMFRVFVGRGPMSLTDLETRINDWVNSNPEWTQDTVDHTLKEFRDPDENVLGHLVPVRFTEDDTKANLLQKLEDKLKDKTDWYRVGYHVCDHDEPPDGQSTDGLYLDDKTEWTAKDVTIPSGVPSFEVTA